MNWFIFGLFALGAVAHLSYLCRGRYPRLRNECTPGEDAVCLLLELALCVWIWHHWL